MSALHTRPAPGRRAAIRLPFLALLGLGVLPLAPMAQATALSTETGLSCETTPKPTPPLDAQGQGVIGDVTVQARFAGGRVTQVDLVQGRPEHLAAVREAMQGYRCDPTASRTLTMTFEFRDPAVTPTPKYPAGDRRNSLVGHNTMIRADYPTRVDALFNVDEVDPALLVGPKPIYLARPDLTPDAAQLTGHWKLSLSMLIDTDGKVRHFDVPGNPPQAFRDMLADAAARMSFKPATYDGRPYPVLAEQNFDFVLEARQASPVRFDPPVIQPEPAAATEGRTGWRVGPMWIALPPTWASDAGLGLARMTSTSGGTITFVGLRATPQAMEKDFSLMNDPVLGAYRFTPDRSWLRCDASAQPFIGGMRVRGFNKAAYASCNGQLPNGQAGKYLDIGVYSTHRSMTLRAYGTEEEMQDLRAAISLADWDDKR